jgi:secondary thiamine-phosphate synthase enzyme
MLYHFTLKTEFKGFVSLTDEIKKAVAISGVQSGICLVYTPHTTAALTVTSFWDTKGFEDIQDEICRLVPTRIDFKHQHDTPQDAAGHVKSSLIGVSLSFIIEKGQLLVGHSQGAYFVEFDGPRDREYYVKIQPDAN